MHTLPLPLSILYLLKVKSVTEKKPTKNEAINLCKAVASKEKSH